MSFMHSLLREIIHLDDDIPFPNFEDPLSNSYTYPLPNYYHRGIIFKDKPDYTQKLVSAISPLSDPHSKISEIDENIALVSSEFLKDAFTTAQILFNEKNFPSHHKSLPPLDTKGFEYRQDNLYFRFITDDDQEYNGHEIAMKAANREYLGMVTLISCGLPLEYRIPLVGIIDGGPMRLIVSSVVDIQVESDLVFGFENMNANSRVLAENYNVNEILHRLSLLLNLKPHFAGLGPKKSLISMPATLQVYSSDQGYVMLNAARLFPPSFPLRKKRGSVWCECFRQEYLRTLPFSISCDVGSPWGEEGKEEEAQFLLEAQEALLQLRLSVFATYLTSVFVASFSISELPLRLSSLLHRFGLNVRYLGVLRHFLLREGNGSELAKLVLSEMTARAIKQYLRSRVLASVPANKADEERDREKRKSRSLSNHSANRDHLLPSVNTNRIFSSVLKDLFGDTPTAAERWTSRTGVKLEISLRFPGSMLPEMEDLRPYLNMEIVFERLQQGLGLFLRGLSSPLSSIYSFCFSSLGQSRWYEISGFQLRQKGLRIDKSLQASAFGGASLKASSFDTRNQLALTFAAISRYREAIEEDAKIGIYEIPLMIQFGRYLINRGCDLANNFQQDKGKIGGFELLAEAEQVFWVLEKVSCAPTLKGYAALERGRALLHKARFVDPSASEPIVNKASSCLDAATLFYKQASSLPSSSSSILAASLSSSSLRGSQKPPNSYAPSDNSTNLTHDYLNNIQENFLAYREEEWRGIEGRRPLNNRILYLPIEDPKDLLGSIDLLSLEDYALSVGDDKSLGLATSLLYRGLAEQTRSRLKPISQREDLFRQATVFYQLAAESPLAAFAGFRLWGSLGREVAQVAQQLGDRIKQSEALKQASLALAEARRLSIQFPPETNEEIHATGETLREAAILAMRRAVLLSEQYSTSSSTSGTEEGLGDRGSGSIPSYLFDGEERKQQLIDEAYSLFGEAADLEPVWLQTHQEWGKALLENANLADSQSRDHLLKMAQNHSSMSQSQLNLIALQKYKSLILSDKPSVSDTPSPVSVSGYSLPLMVSYRFQSLLDEEEEEEEDEEEDNLQQVETFHEKDNLETDLLDNSLASLNSSRSWEGKEDYLKEIFTQLHRLAETENGELNWTGGPLLSSPPPPEPETPSLSRNTPPPMTTGFLWKRGGVVKNWKQRWTVIDSTSLRYFVKPESIQPRGTLPTERIRNVKEENLIQPPQQLGPHGFVFALTHAKRTYYFATDSEEDRKAWMNSIQAHILFQHTKQRASTFVCF